ncbi:metal ABC transporter solute-binding protein, Zn/Mn family [Dethiobacter alkaliphilus]|uniref:metal ABC transporter solute-binding protein, Zn/Mn family n=1 Tax=Dethiobacter alkaliphilus TaxID=427926 RepID=UPI002227AD11|nr:zinc ABC transporter substrate-binding protein [Dethiobacter alkaliphilus]MCW3489194.1 zinc ABC transporter substrate-binding protein [Dethiobacter alkaliphilus]
MKKIFLFLILALLVPAMVLTGCAQPSAQGTAAESEPDITVYTSFYVLYDFANQIGGDRVEVMNLLPPGVEPHDWEPTSQAMVRLSAADLLLINGLDLEPWIDTIVDGLDGNITVINTSEGIDPLKGYAGHSHSHYHDDDCDHDDDEDCEYDHDEECDDDDDHGDDNNSGQDDDHEDEKMPDPHVWLDPLLALHQAEQIAGALIEMDPEYEEVYLENLALFTARIEELDNEYREALTNLARHEFIVTHLSFAYLAERYGLEQVGISGLSPHAEPSPAQMAKIMDFAAEHDVRHIFQEPLVTSRLAEVLADDLGAEILELNPLEGLTEDELAAGEDYFSIMRRNLEQLKIALAE